MLSLTLLRPIRTRARGPEDPAHNEDLLRGIYAMACSVLTGDIRKSRCEYVGDLPVDEAADMLYHVMLDTFVADLGACRPSPAKWWTQEPSLVSQSGFSNCHHLYERFSGIQKF